MKPKEYKTVMVCTDELLNQMSRDGWNIEHLQFDNGVLRGVFWRNADVAQKPADSIKIVVNPVVGAGDEVVVHPVGTNPDMYRRPPMNPPYPQNLKRVSVDDRIAELDADLMEGLRQYLDTLKDTEFVPRPLGQLVEVNP